MAKPRSITWQPHNDAVPPAQGDLVLVAWAKTIEPSTSLAAGARPVIGARDALDMPLWDEQLPVLAMWGRMNYGMAVIIPDGCAIDKDYNTLFVGSSLRERSVSTRN